MDKQRFRAPMVGGSSLLVIFAVLCLTVFALLGLSMVHADRRLAQASIRAVTDYYAADCEAERILARLRSGEHLENVLIKDGICVYACPISDTQQLLVQVQIAGVDDWEILRWQAVSTSQQNTEETLNVWNGESTANYD